MEGLEALVQAATQERKRLDEITDDQVNASSPRTPSRSQPQQSPLLTSLDRTIRSSPVAERDATVDVHQSHTLVAEMRLSYETRQTLSSPSTQSVGSTQASEPPLRNSISLISSPISPRFSAPFSRQSLQITHPADVVMEAGEMVPPPAKRRRSSERHVQPLITEPPPTITSMSHPLLASHTSPTISPLIGPGVAPPSEKTHTFARDKAVELNMSGNLGRAELGQDVLTLSTQLPVRPFATPQGSDRSPVLPTPEVVDVRDELSNTLTIPQSVDPIVPAEEASYEVRSKPKKRRSEGKEGSKSKDKDKAKERPLKGSRPKASSEFKTVPSSQHELAPKGDDTDDWFREQFGEPEESKLHDIQPVSKSALASPESATQSVPIDIPHKRLPQSSPPIERPHYPGQRARSPTPLAILEAELDDVPVISSPPMTSQPLYTKSSPPSSRHPPPLDMDLDTELERAVADDTEIALPVKPRFKPKPKAKVKPKPEVKHSMDLDVEDELLKLLDDEGEEEKNKKHRSHHPHIQPSVAAAKKETATSSVALSHGVGLTESRGRTKHISKVNKLSVLGSAAGSPAMRGSPVMPPPISRETSQVREASASRGGKDDELPTTAPTPADRSPVPTPAPTPAPGSMGKGKESTASTSKVRSMSVFWTLTHFISRRKRPLGPRARQLQPRNRGHVPQPSANIPPLRPHHLTLRLTQMTCLRLLARARKPRQV